MITELLDAKSLREDVSLLQIGINLLDFNGIGRRWERNQ